MTAGSDQRRRTVYSVVALWVIGAVAALCVAARRLGLSRTGADTGDSYEVFDVGHPGIVNAITSMGFVCVATAQPSAGG